MSGVNQQRPAPMPAPMPMPVPYPILQPQPSPATALRLLPAFFSLIFLGLAGITTYAPHVDFMGLAALFLVSATVLGINIAFNLYR